jgi:lipopolysaccharide cholinephosphotransferase
MEDFSKYNGTGTILRKSQLAALDILIEFDRICRKNGLTYMLEFGTLLGAVRHGGFIPWDDDVDVTMPSDDYKRFQEIALSELGQGFILQTEKTEPESGMGGGMFKIRKENTLWINDYDDFRRHYHKGISIDVFENQDYPDVSRKVIKFFRRRLSKAFGFTHYFNRISFKNVIAYFIFPISALFFKTLWKLICLVHKCNKEQPHIERLAISYPSFKKDLYPVSEIMFEGYSFMAPHNPDARLKDIYGDYMQIPPEESRVIHAKFISTDTSVNFTNM